MRMTAATWGLAGPRSPSSHGALGDGAGAAVLLQWRRALGARDHGDGDGDEMPDLGLYELATLGDEPDLAITSAASGGCGGCGG